jgi:hypothetical protein
MRPYLEAAAATGRSQVAAVGTAQETMRVFVARKRDTDPAKCPQFSFDKADRRVTVYYFYLWDENFGPAFIKICTYCFKTKVITRGTEVTINAFYKHSRIKQYLKDGRALRIETVINAPNDLRVQRRLHNLDELQAKGRAINARLLHAERVGQGCHLANPVFERIAHPTVTAEGRRASALRFGDSRVQALAGALCVTLCAVTGITNRSLRALMTGLLGAPYTMTQASYDLARLRRNGLITRRPHSNTYDMTADGLRFAIFYTKVCNRVLAPLFTAGQPQAPPELRDALRTIDHHIADLTAHARLPPAA